MTMDIQFEVSGGSHKLVRAKLVINGNVAGELQVIRDDFTKLCEVLFQSGYIIKGKTAHDQI